MKIIHKIAAVVVENNKFLVVHKVDSPIWTSLGGKPEAGETEEEALLREVKEEFDCECSIVKKLGDFEAKAGEDEAIVRLSTFLVDLIGDYKLSDPELDDYKFIDKDYKEEGIKMPASLVDQVIPYCIKEGILNWE